MKTRRIGHYIVDNNGNSDQQYIVPPFKEKIVTTLTYTHFKYND